MKKQALYLLPLLLLSLSGCTGAPEKQAPDKGEELMFEKHLHEYGEILQDSDGSCVFTFKNLGAEALVINRVRSTCGCTVPQWPREPVAPGEGGEIKVVYNTATTGSFFKSIFVYSSAANSPVKLQIKGKVTAME